VIRNEKLRDEMGVVLKGGRDDLKGERMTLNF
jgi:hypothetical protein